MIVSTVCNTMMNVHAHLPHTMSAIVCDLLSNTIVIATHTSVQCMSKSPGIWSRFDFAALVSVLCKTLSSMFWWFLRVLNRHFLLLIHSVLIYFFYYLFLIATAALVSFEVPLCRGCPKPPPKIDCPSRQRRQTCVQRVNALWSERIANNPLTD